MPDHCRYLALALLTLAGGCAPSAATLSSGVVHVSFTSDETCGFSNPYTVEARGCSQLDAKAVMCKGFGVIDGVLFAGGCEAPAEIELLETQGTLPLSPPRSEPEPAEKPPVAPAANEPQTASDEPATPVEKKAADKKARASSKSSGSKKGKTKKSRRKKR